MTADEIVTAEPGLRERKKAQRRERILAEATRLFDRQGISATTMADIATASGISPATVFNYFGSKDSIILAMISEGVARAYETGFIEPPAQAKSSFDHILVQMFCDVVRHTFQIAPPRVWRFAESGVIRHPDTALALEYQSIETRLIGAIAKFLSAYELEFTSKEQPDHLVLAQVFHDTWNAEFLRLIQTNGDVQSDLVAHLEPKISTLCRLIFTPDFIRNPKLKASSNES